MFFAAMSLIPRTVEITVCAQQNAVEGRQEEKRGGRNQDLAARMGALNPKSV